MDEHQRVDEAWRDRNGPVDAPAALLEGFEDQRLAVEIDAGDRQRQRLGDPAAGEVQDLAEGARLALGLFGRDEKCGALGGGQIQPVAGRVDQVGHGEHKRPGNVLQLWFACRSPASKDKAMDQTNPIWNLVGLSFLIFWLLFAILLVKLLRSGLSGGTPAREPTDGAHGPVIRSLLRDDRLRAAAGRNVENTARSYFSKATGIVHLIALGMFAATTLSLGLWAATVDKEGRKSHQTQRDIEAPI